MKILWLYQHMAGYNFDHHLHMSFAQVVNQYPGVELKAYGPEISNNYPSLSLLKHQHSITLSDIYKLFQFDVVIVNTKSRCFAYYNPRTKRAEGCWLPPDFATWANTPKVMIEEDYHYEEDDAWYKDMQFDLILHRHYSQSLRPHTVPCRFLPFSVDTDVFNPWRTQCQHKGLTLTLPSLRINKIAFVGNDADRAYIYRRTATTKLIDQQLGVTYSGSKKVDGEYIQVLRQYLGYTSCGSTYHICAAKNLEIMASGGVLITNKFKGIELLFPEDTYCSYGDDCSDIVTKVRHLLNDQAYAADLVNKGLRLVRNKHSHNIRIKELLDIIGEL